MLEYDIGMVKKKGSKAAGGLSTRALVITLAIGVLLGAGAVAVLLNQSVVVERRTGRQVPDFRGLVDTTGFTLKAAISATHRSWCSSGSRSARMFVRPR